MCIGSIYVVGEEADENALLFELKNGRECLKPNQYLTVKDNVTLTVKVLNPTIRVTGYQFWCKRVDKNTTNDSKVFETNMTYMLHTQRPNYAAAAIPIESALGEFDCFLGVDPHAYDQHRHNTIYDENSRYKELCRVRLNVTDTSSSDVWVILGVVFAGVSIIVVLSSGVAAAIFRCRRQWRRNEAMSKSEVSQID
ncbi:uncharacterized protein LOC113238820 [Hyposmocoma kahamanoa]|uniref:uncharacterized protein LOC113238820 n=1 Tax=Hyposmocoma kahamanoa TaxID=1477025 RepID=UPI000E6D6B35|nr:uncharacterized protein LOC113238820 [Hyposmocoma kahamanoa]